MCQPRKKGGLNVPCVLRSSDDVRVVRVFGHDTRPGVIDTDSKAVATIAGSDHRGGGYRSGCIVADPIILSVRMIGEWNK